MLCIGPNPKGSAFIPQPHPKKFLVAVDLSPGESHRGKYVFLSVMNLLHLDIKKFGGTRPWGQEIRSHSLKVLAFAFSRISGMAVSGWQQDLSEKSWELCGSGLVL